MTENKEPENMEQPAEKKEEKKTMDLKTKVIGDFTQYDINTIRNSLAAGLNPEEFNLFLNTAVSAGLNPFLGHILPVLYNADDPSKRKLNIQIAVEGIEHLARTKDGWQGCETQLVCEKDEFKAKRDAESGGWVIESHEISFPRGKVMAAYSIAKRQGFQDVYVFMEVEEVERLKTEFPSSKMWGKWFNDMFKKHVKKRALREQFGIELDDIENAAGGPTAINDGPGNYVPKAANEITQDDDDKEPNFDQELEKFLADMDRLTKEYNLSQDDVIDIKRRRLELEPGDDLNPQQVASLKRFIELEGPGIQKARKARKEAAEAEIKETAKNSKMTSWAEMSEAAEEPAPDPAPVETKPEAPAADPMLEDWENVFSNADS